MSVSERFGAFLFSFFAQAGLRGYSAEMALLVFRCLRGRLSANALSPGSLSCGHGPCSACDRGERGQGLLRVERCHPRPFRRRRSRPRARAIARATMASPLKPISLMQAVIGGTSDYFAAMHGRPNGPQTIEELSRWPATLLEKALSGDDGVQKRRRLETALQCGLVLHTDFSGKASVEVSLRMLGVAAARAGLHLPEEWLQLWRNADNDRTCQRILLSDDHGAAHVFTGVLDMLPPERQKKIRSFRLGEAADVESRKQAYANLQKYLATNAKAIFIEGASSMSCLRHPGVPCALQWPIAGDDADGARPVRMNFSGPMCTPWSSHGKQEGEGSEDMESFHLWLHMMARSNMDIIGFENSNFFPIELFRQPLMNEFEVVHAIFGSEDLGFPARRSRTYAAAVNKKYFVWVGPTDPAQVQQLFLATFQCVTVLDGDSFVGIDSEANTLAHRQYMARLRGIFGDVKEPPPLLPVCGCQCTCVMRALWQRSQ